MAFKKSDMCNIVIFTDSSLGGEPNGRSQLGYIICCVEGSPGEDPSAIESGVPSCHILHYVSKIQRRVATSSLAAEAYALDTALDAGQVIGALYMSAGIKPYYHVVTDCYSLLTCMNSITPQTQELRILPVIYKLKSEIGNLDSRTYWAQGTNNPADALTKERAKCAAGRKVLCEIMDTGKLDGEKLKRFRA